MFIQIRLFEPHSVSVFWDSAVASVNVTGNDVRPAGWLVMHLERAAGNWGSIILTLFTEIYKCIHERVKNKERESKRERETFRIWESENCECRHFFSRKSFSHMPLKRQSPLKKMREAPILWTTIQRWKKFMLPRHLFTLVYLLIRDQVTGLMPPGVRAGYPERMWSSASWREDLWWASLRLSLMKTAVGNGSSTNLSHLFSKETFSSSSDDARLITL